MSSDDKVLEALNWLTHVAYGVGKNGGTPKDEEWKDAIEAAKKALAQMYATPGKKGGQP